MGYLYKDQYGVFSVLDESTLNEPKEIRFITPEYREIFRIPDGGQILICYPDGEKKAETCKYIDSYHVLVGIHAFHICEFAERIEAVRAHVQPFPEKRMIWQNIDLDLEDWIGDLKAEHPGLTKDEYNDMMIELNREHLSDERMNLDIPCEDIVAIGDIGRWDGRVTGYKVFENCKISDCLTTDCDYAEWYVDRDGEFRCREIHHDGTNYIYYRVFKEAASYDDRNELLGKLYKGKASQQDIDRLTDKLGSAIGKVYGWEFPTEKQNVRVYERG